MPFGQITPGLEKKSSISAAAIQTGHRKRSLLTEIETARIVASAPAVWLDTDLLGWIALSIGGTRGDRRTPASQSGRTPGPDVHSVPQSFLGVRWHHGDSCIFRDSRELHLPRVSGQL